MLQEPRLEDRFIDMINPEATEAARAQDRDEVLQDEIEDSINIAEPIKTVTPEPRPTIHSKEDEKCYLVIDSTNQRNRSSKQHSSSKKSKLRHGYLRPGVVREKQATSTWVKDKVKTSKKANPQWQKCDSSSLRRLMSS